MESFINGLKNEINSFNESTIDSIIKSLPDLLKGPCDILTTEVEKEVFLLGSIGTVSGILPNVLGKYNGDWVGTNLFIYILGQYGGGKGGLKWAKALVTNIHQAKAEERTEMLIEYEKEKVLYKKELRIFNKSKSNMTPPSPPSRPPSKMLFIPINNSKSGVYQLLQENKNRGIMFETEGDTLADALRQDYGNYSDLLRKVFHHETLDFFRRENNEIVDIEKPFLSVVLSSTPDQLLKLITSTSNGLYSRFLFYYLKEETQFVNVFDSSKSDYDKKFQKFATIYKEMYDYLENLESPIYFILSNKQKEEFIKYFNEKKQALIEGISPSMSGSANRFGIIAYRIMMIFTVLRKLDTSKTENTLKCEDVDFNNALKIVERLETHAIRVYEYLGKKPDKKGLAISLRENGASLREIEKVTKINKGTLSKWFKK